jgi:hypothetical protein
MKITPKVDDKKLQRKLDQQIREQPRQVQKVLGRTAEFLMGLIKQRTQRGKNVDGLTFAPYSTKPYFSM